MGLYGHYDEARSKLVLQNTNYNEVMKRMWYGGGVQWGMLIKDWFHSTDKKL